MFGVNMLNTDLNDMANDLHTDSILIERIHNTSKKK